MIKFSIPVTGVATGVLTSDETNPAVDDTVTIGVREYTFKLRYATATLTSDETNVSAEETVTIGAQTYTFVTALTEDGENPGEVVIGDNAAGSLANLVAAINKATGGGTTYDSATVANALAGAGDVSSHTTLITAKTAGVAGNAVGVETDSDHLSFGSEVEFLSNGYDPDEDEVYIAATTDLTLTQLANAINGVAPYTADPLVTSSAVATNALTITARVAGAVSNNVATTEDSSHLSWGGSTLSGGIGGSIEEMTFDDDSAAFYTDALNVEPYKEAIAFLTVHDVVGDTGTLDVKFQLSPDGTNWVDAGDAFTQVTTSETTTFKRLSANFGDYVRGVITLGGTSPEYTLTLSLAAKTYK